ncbi:MAG: hypothetical protein HY326_03550 [Chloroflexi bacterium]|nr:hypothetical protein [Chloroflexota bacterium]
MQKYINAATVLILYLHILSACSPQVYLARARPPKLENAKRAASIEAPPRFLTAEEAVDLARYRGWLVPGGVATVPEASEVLLAEMSWVDAKEFLEASSSVGFYPGAGRDRATDRVFFVVVRGRVSNSMAGGAPILGTSLAMVLDKEAHAFYIGIGSPWGSLAPPASQQVPLQDVPNFQMVSYARAQNEFGSLIEPLYLPQNLSLQRIDINPQPGRVDPSEGVLDRGSITFTYVDTAGEPRVWLTQTWLVSQPQVDVPGSAIQVSNHQGTRYSRQIKGGKNSRQILSLAWQPGDRWIYLSAILGPDLTEAAVLDIAMSIYTYDVPHMAPTALPK